jgi:anaerobic C4-dicarboxylate transporter DcuA
MTILAGTGHTAFSTLPVITEVAKEQGIRPSRPLSIAVVASQIAITASPISAAVVFFAGILEPMGVSYLTLLAICIPVTLIAVMITAVLCNFLGAELKDDPVYQERLAKGEVSLRGSQVFELKPHAKRSVLLFLIGIVAVMFYATAISDTVGLIQNPVLPRNEAIVVFMLTIATLISITCKIDTSEVLNASTFKSGMSACVCVLGVAWLGDTFVKAHISDIQTVAGDLLHNYPWLLAVCCSSRLPALLPGGDHQSADACGADAGCDAADGNCLFCGGFCPVRIANLPNPAGGGGDGRHRLNPYR